MPMPEHEFSNGKVNIAVPVTTTFQVLTWESLYKIAYYQRKYWVNLLS